ncbi:MAG: hypothetical protein LLG06_19670 [Desulfobacteraceae bacterium]|nr:hypothetical protein [Desulfobacteraceae bacterium]
MSDNETVHEETGYRRHSGKPNFPTGKRRVRFVSDPNRDNIFTYAADVAAEKVAAGVMEYVE